MLILATSIKFYIVYPWCRLEAGWGCRGSYASPPFEVLAPLSCSGWFGNREEILGRWQQESAAVSSLAMRTPSFSALAFDIWLSFLFLLISVFSVLVNGGPHPCPPRPLTYARRNNATSLLSALGKKLHCNAPCFQLTTMWLYSCHGNPGILPWQCSSALTHLIFLWALYAFFWAMYAQPPTYKSLVFQEPFVTINGWLFWMAWMLSCLQLGGKFSWPQRSALQPTLLDFSPDAATWFWQRYVKRIFIESFEA